MKKTLLAMSIALATPAAFAGNIFVFGDSLSDIGQNGWANQLDAQSHYHAVATYYNSDATPNLLYDQIVSKNMGGGTLVSRFPLSDSVNQGTSISYAFSGAYLDPSNAFLARSFRQNHKGGLYSDAPNPIANVLDADHIGMGWHQYQPYLSIQNQINRYVQDVIQGNYKPKAGDMFILWGGGNDVAAIMSAALGLRDQPIQQVELVKNSLTHTAQTLAKEALTLKAFGGGQLLLVAPNLPNIVYTPEILDQMVKTVGAQFYSAIRTVGTPEGCEGKACVLGYKAPETTSQPAAMAAQVADAFYVGFMKTYQSVLNQDARNTTQHNIQDLTATRHKILLDLVNSLWTLSPVPEEMKEKLQKAKMPTTYGDALMGNKDLAQKLKVPAVTKEVFTQYLITQYDSLAQQAATVTAKFNMATDQALKGVGGYILRLNTDALFKDMLDHPEAYGFKNLVASVCNYHSPYVKCQVDATPSPIAPTKWNPTADYKDASFTDGKLQPGKDGSEMPMPTNPSEHDIGLQAANGTGKDAPVKTGEYFFTDGFHPGPLAHHIMADYLMSAYNAPKAVVKLREPFVSQVQSVSQDFMSENAQHQINAWTQQALSASLKPNHLLWPNHRLEAQLNYRYTTAGNNTLLMGLRGEVNPKVQLGAFYRFAQFQHQQDGVDGKGRLHALALNAQYSNGNYWVGGLAGYLSGQYHIERTVQLGPRTLIQTANPPMKAYTASLFGGYRFDQGNWYASVSGNLTYSLGLIEKYTEKEATPVQEGFDPQGFKVLQMNVFSQFAVKVPYDVVPHVRLGWHHIVNQWGNAIGAYLNGFHYGVERVGLNQDRNWFSASMGVTHQPVNGRWYLSLNLEKDLLRSGHNGLGVNLQGGIRF